MHPYCHVTENNNIIWPRPQLPNPLSINYGFGHGLIAIFLRKKIFAPPPGQHFWGNMEKYGKIGKIWHRGNFSPKVVIYETGCGNFP